MSDYIVSARKYRPDSFESLIGQDNIAQTLKNSILRGKLAHAYLFCGPRGVGKTSTARIFAKMINCSNPSAEMEPCGECESCRSFQEGRSYCIHELDAASNNGVDDIKALMDQVQIPPQVGRYSVFIIDEVHMLSQAAFNAFLKTLEEPPAHAIFILATTEKHKILPTILSRCQTYDFNRISISGIVKNLKDIAEKEGISIDDESLHIIAQKADGAMRDALTIFDQTVAFCGTDIKAADVMRNLNVLDYEYSFSLVDSFLRGDYASALLTFDEVLAKGFNAQHFISALSSHLRDIIVSRTAGLESLLDLPDSLKARYAAQAQSCCIKWLYDALAITTQCEAGYKASINPRLHIEFTLMKLSFLAKAPAAPAQAVQEVKEIPERVGDDSKKQVGDDVKSVVDDVKSVVDDVKPEPAPVAPTPAPAPRQRRGPVKTASSLSMSSLMKEDTADATSETTEDMGGTMPEDAEVIGAWSRLVENYSNMPRLYNTLKGAAIICTENDGMKTATFKVDNLAQKMWIEEKLIKDMEGKMRMLVSSSKVVMTVDVTPQEEQPQKAYTADEKARELIKNNPQVKDFVIDLGLDIKQ